MQKEQKEFFHKLLNTPSPSGFETKIQKVVKRRMKKYADEIDVDVHGNLIAAFNPTGKIRVMLAGHCDQIGLMVTHIDEKGFLYVGQIGGVDPAVLPGSNLTIHTENGPLDAIIGHKAIHLLTAAERGKKIALTDAWVDIGAKDGKEARKLVRIGDPITYKLGVTELGKNKVCSPGLDDKTGLYVVMEALRIVSTKIKGAAKKKFPVALFAVSTVQEEIGLRGARTSCFGIDPLVGIAVDVGHSDDNPGGVVRKTGSFKLGAGPGVCRGANINPVLEELIAKTAKKKKIAFQSMPSPGATGTDANAMQITRSGVAASLISIPNRYMHSQVEVCDYRDLDAAAKLIAETIMAMTSRMTFIPG